MKEGDLEYSVGDIVILGEHDLVDGRPSSKYWSDSMNKYVGREAVIKSDMGIDPYGYRIYAVDVDAGQHYWRAISMFTTHQGNGCICFYCKELYPYTKKVAKFVCWECKNVWGRK